MKRSFVYYRNKPIIKIISHGTTTFALYMLVDTGADYVSVPPLICERLGWPRLGSRQVVVPGRQIEVPFYKGVIEFGKLRRSLTIMAVDLPGFDYVDGLLGREFIDLFEVCFRGGERLSFVYLERTWTGV